MKEKNKKYIEAFRATYAYEKLNADSKGLSVALFRLEGVDALLQIAEKQQKIIEDQEIKIAKLECNSCTNIASFEKIKRENSENIKRIFEVKNFRGKK